MYFGVIDSVNADMFEAYQHDQIWDRSFSGGMFPINSSNRSYLFGIDENASPLIKDKKSCKGAAARIYNTCTKTANDSAAIIAGVGTFISAGALVAGRGSVAAAIESATVATSVWFYNNEMADCELTQTEMNLNCDESFK